HHAARAERAPSGGPHFRGVRGADRELARTADSGEEAQEREPADAFRHASERGGDAGVDNRVAERIAPSDAVGEDAEADRADGVADEEYRADEADRLHGDAEILGDRRREQPEQVHGVGTEAVTEPSRDG